jgi:SAM-dependent methyltransferase
LTEAPASIRPKLPKRALLRQLRRILYFRNRIDLDELHALIETLQNSQRKIESDQQEMKGIVQVLSAEMALLKQEISVDRQSQRLSLMNIKNLGYELGRIMAERDLQKTAAAPGFTKLTGKLCTQDDFETDWLLYWSQELRTVPYYHRKIWELCYICQVLFAEGKLAPQQRGVGFGCGQEPLPSLFAKYGVHVMATDLDQDRPEADVWRMTHQHAATAESFRRRDICPDEQRLANIEFRPIDMNSIPPEFDGQFDFCWSACALEHLGSLAKGLEFVENSLRSLKPGGIAVHTTEFTLDEGETIDNYPTVLFQSRHLIEFADNMRQKGYEVVRYDFTAGSGVLDRFVDLPPWTHDLHIPPQHFAHLKLSIDGFTCTSVGMIIKKPVCFGGRPSRSSA